MTETTQLDLGLIKITLAQLPQQQIVRLMAMPSDIPLPVAPEGYTHEQAMQHIESYKKEWNDRQATISTITMLREIGTARMLAIDLRLVTEDEKAALVKLCKRYAFAKSPDELDDPYQIGSALYEIGSEFGDPVCLYESNLWLRNKAGFISDAAVQEILKSLRRAGEQETDTGSGGANQPQEQTKEPATDHVLEPV